ncbi:MAG: DUF1028 domain-containing protein [Chloroflexi bacterium]|nr:DUF1028 domain-containing protein [Chloroflexota bacterium]
MIVSTFSIAAVDRDSGEVGVAVASRFLAVGAVVPWARAGAGAIVTQAMANMADGTRGLDLLAQGLSAEETLARLTHDDPELEHRQIALVALGGGSAAHTGGMCMPWAGHRGGPGYTCQGNILSGPRVVDAMADAFESSGGPLPERMLGAIRAGEAIGGDSRGRQSAALYVAKEGGSFGGHLDRFIDLRVDDHPDPLPEVARLLELHRQTFGSGGRPTLVRLQGNVVREVQRALKTLGYYSGELTAVYDTETSAAMQSFCNVENLEERLAASRDKGPEWTDREIVNLLRSRGGLAK